MPNDPKWRTIARASGQSIATVQAVFLQLMVSASSNEEERGVTQCNAEDIASALDISTDAVESIQNAMQGRVLNEKKLTGWEKRQPKREDSSADRVKAFRERQSVTHCNAAKRGVTLEEKREEEKREEEIQNGKSHSEPVSRKKKAVAFAVPEEDLPTWLDVQTWRNFEEHRRRKKNPLDDLSAPAILKELALLRDQGEDPVQVLNEAIARDWATAFTLRRDSNRPSETLSTLSAPLTPQRDPVAEVLRQREEARAAIAAENAANQTAQPGLELLPC